jgi:hypothetical protein
MTENKYPMSLTPKLVIGLGATYLRCILLLSILCDLRTERA